MSKKWPKIIQDPIHKLISFEDNECDHLLLKLIDTREFQRLRRIKQLGVSEFVFPTATHNRFSHSVGVLHIAKRIIERVEKQLEPVQKTTILCAALLHDIGHGPFSHAFEKITNEDHEKRTLDIIKDDSTETNRILCEFDREFPKRIASYFLTEDREDNDRTDDYYSDIVSSQLDADRFDYLLRDSYMTGTCYGNFDLDWIIQRLYVDKQKRRFYLSKKAFSAAETYIFSRYHMYRSVYFHKATRAAEVMLKLLFSQFKKLIKDDPNQIRQIIPDVSSTLVHAFS